MEQATPQGHRIGWYLSDKDWAFKGAKEIVCPKAWWPWQHEVQGTIQYCWSIKNQKHNSVLLKREV